MNLLQAVFCILLVVFRKTVLDSFLQFLLDVRTNIANLNLCTLTNLVTLLYQVTTTLLCGKAWEEGRTLIVPDVEKFPGHIACSSLSLSEIVVPMYDDSHTFRGVLDIDSTRLNDFNEDDKEGLERIIELLMA